MAYVATVRIIVTEDRRGTGRDENLFRMVPQLFTEDGTLIGEHDPVKDGPMVNFTALLGYCRRANDPSGKGG